MQSFLIEAGTYIVIDGNKRHGIVAIDGQYLVFEYIQPSDILRSRDSFDQC